MPNPKQFTIDQELRFFTELENINLRNERFRSTMTPDLARNVSTLANTAPRAPKEVIMYAGRALTDNLMVPSQAEELVTGVEKKVLTSPITYQFDAPSAWDRAFGGFKTAAKWGLAGVMFAPEMRLQGLGALVGGAIDLLDIPKQLVTNISQTGQAWSDPRRLPNASTARPTEFAEYIGVPELPGSQSIPVIRDATFTPPSIDGQSLGTVFRGTTLGALLSGADSGNGYFIGEEAARIQNESLKQTSGTINGQPMTPGRGLALAVSRPDTKPYLILSSLVDIAAQLSPTPVPIAPAVRRVAALGADIDIAPILRPFTNVQPDEAIPLLRSTAGLTNFNTPFIVREKVGQFLDSAMGQSVMKRLADTDSYEEVAKLFPKTDINFRQAVVNATDDTIREVLETNLGLSRGVMDVRDTRLGRLSDARRAFFDNAPARWSGAERLFADRAGKEIAVLTDDPRTATRSVENLTNYLISLRVAPARRKELINKLASTLTDATQNPRQVLKEIQDEVVAQLARQRGLPEEMLNSMFSRFAEFKDRYVLFGQYGADDFSMMFAMDDVRTAGMIGKSADGSSGIFLIPDGTAMGAGEMRRASMFLPDPDRVYRATSQWRWLFETWSRDPEKFGNPNTSVLLLSFLNTAFKRFATMTGGYITRNLAESGARAALAPGVKGGVLNPIEYLTTATWSKGFSRYLGDVEGVPFTEYGKAVIYREFDDFKDAVEQTIRQNMAGDMIEKRAAQTGAWQIVTNNQPALYPQMLMDNIQILSSDEIYRMVARRMTTDEIIYEIMQKTPETQVALKNLQRLHSNVTLQNAYTGKYEKAVIEYIDEAGNPNEFNLRKFIDLYVRPRVGYNTGGTRRPDGTYLLDGDDRLLEIIANGDRLGWFTSGGRTVDAFTSARLGPAGELVSIDYSDGFRALISEIIDDPVMGPRMPVKGKARINMDPQGAPGVASSIAQNTETFVNAFFSHLFSKPDAVLNRSPVWRQYYYLKIGDLIDDLAPGEAEALRQSVLRGRAYNVNEDIRKILNVRPDAEGLYQYGTKKLTQDQWLKMLYGRLRKLDFSKEDATARVDQLRDTINNHPKDLRATVIELANEARNKVLGTDRFGARWVGSKDLWKKIIDKANGTVPSTGDLTAEQIGQVAKIFAGEATQKVFYDAAAKSNIGQILPIIAPFGTAWREMIRFYSRALVSDYSKVKKAAVYLNESRSYFEEDPITGEPYFSYLPTNVMLPLWFAFAGTMGGRLAGATLMKGVPAAIPTAVGAAGGAAIGAGIANQVSDVDVNLRAPARGLSMAFDVRPGIGPIVQIPANQLLNRVAEDVKSLDAVRNFLFPYGPPEGLIPPFTPAYLRKLAQAFTQDPETDSLYGQLSMDSFYALMSTGEYDRTNREDVSRAWEKAKTIGGWLTIAQGIGQFVGPARPSVTMQIKTEFEGLLTAGDIEVMVENGDVSNLVLARLFRYLQEQDYDTAPAKFIEMVGENAIYLMAGRTTTGTAGLQATKEFSDWQAKNLAFAETHKEVFSWFSPIGSTFDKQAYILQIQRGLRERRTDPFKAVEDAEYIAASGLYRMFLNELSEDGEISPLDKERLKMYRQDLKEYFPGYGLRPQVTNRTESLITRSVAAANDSRMEGNVVAEAVKAYDEWRRWAIDSAQARRQAQGRNPAISNILKGQANADLRAELRRIGELIIQETPEFARIYDAVFYFEIDEVG